MNPLDRDTFDALLTPREAPCVSVYLPLQRAHTHAHENAGRLKSALSDAEQRLSGMGLSPKGRSQLLAPARQLADDTLALPVAFDSLALFVSRESFHAVGLPFPSRESLSIGRRFHVAPLILVLQASELRFHILAMSRNRCRLLRVAAGSVTELQIGGMPHSVADAWKGMEHPEKNLQFHSAGNGNVMFHGGGGAKDQDEIEVGEYVRKVCKALEDGFKGVTDPLVFVGVEELWGVFRKECRYTRLVDEPLAGSPDEQEPDELMRRTMPIVEREAVVEREKALRRFEDAVGAGKTTALPLDVLQAAKDGRVDMLFTAEGEALWGTEDAFTGAVEIKDALSDVAEDLIGLAVASTLQKGGTVLTFPKDKMPEKAVIAALLRY